MHAERQGPMSMGRFVCFFGAVAALTISNGCSSSEQRNLGSAAYERAVVLKGAGATFPAPLYQQWFATYQADHPGTVVTYDVVGSGEGVRRFIGRNVKDEEKIDFGASDGAM